MKCLLWFVLWLVVVVLLWGLLWLGVVGVGWWEFEW